MQPHNLIVDIEYAIATRSDNTAKILRSITDLFVANADRHSADLLGVYDDVFEKLVKNIEVKARAELSQRLAPIENAPANTVRSLMLDDSIEVAEPILTQSKALCEETLAECAASMGQEHLLAIASREKLTTSVTDHLVTRGDKQVLGAVASNPGAKISDQSFGTLVQKSAGDDWLSEAVAMRTDIPDRHLRDLVSKASDVVQKRLMAANPKYSDLIQEVVGVSDDRELPKEPAARKDYRVAEVVVHPLVKSGRLTEAVVKQFADEKKIEEVIVSIAALAQMPSHDIERLVMGGWTSPVVIILKAIGFHLPTFDAIYNSRMSERTKPTKDMAATKAEFLSLKRATAERIMRFYRTRGLSTRSTAN